MEEFIKKGTFLMVNVAAQRARQLMQGAAPLTRCTTRKPAAIAIREVRQGLIPHFMPEQLLLEQEQAVETEEEDETA